MSAFMPAAFAALSQKPTINEALSGLFGSISVTAWICLLLPQLITNYKAKSADGLSMAFLFVWLLGDATNLSGALFTSLAPTAVVLASYFCIADLVLISQCLYYNTLKSRRASRRRTGSVATTSSTAAATDEAASEDEPLLTRRRSSSMGLPGSQRRHTYHTESSLDPLRKMVTGEDDTPDSNPWLHNTLSIAAVWLVGATGWFISYKFGAWDQDPPVVDVPEEVETVRTIGIVLGYFSAVCYLCARIPQIVKNYNEKSCDGLALLFFLLSLTGNSTYGLSLLVYSQDKDDLLRALPWLLGSLGTIVEDLIIFAQFRMYAPKNGQPKSPRV
jgi:uncharacterized protein with PQ loop repeat